MRNPKFSLNEKVGVKDRTDECFITEVDVSPCSCTDHERTEDAEIYYSINDRFIVKESELTKL